MPILNREDATEVEEHIKKIFSAKTTQERVAELQQVFVEKLDFERADGLVSLEGARKNVDLPDPTELIANLEDATVVYRCDKGRSRSSDAERIPRLLHLLPHESNEVQRHGLAGSSA
jgi:flagellar motor component MotA